MLHSFILKLIFFFFFPRVFPVSVNGEEMSVFAVRLPAKYSLEILKHPFTPFTSAVLYCTYLSSLCRTLCNTAYACVERAPICHWAACTSTKQYLVSGFNYRFACVCTYMWLLKVEVFCSPSYPLWTIHLLSLSSVCLSHSVFSPFFCPLVTCTVECFTLLSTLKMLSLPVEVKSFLGATSLTLWPIYKIFLILLHSTHTNNTRGSPQMQKSRAVIVKNFGELKEGKKSVFVLLFRLFLNKVCRDIITEIAADMMTVYLCPCLSSGCFEHHHPLLLSSILLPRPAGLHNADWRFHRCCCLRPHLWLLRGTNTLSTFIWYFSHTGIYESRTRKRFQIFFLFSHKSVAL